MSLWLRDVVLDDSLVKALEVKKLAGQRKGGLAKRNWRVLRQESVINSSKEEVLELSRKELWLLGVMAYWCEGAKQKEHNVSQRIVFSNTDPYLIVLFDKWLKNICKMEEDDILYSLYIHERGNVEESLIYWGKVLKIQTNRFSKTVLKRHNYKTVRKNTGEDYHGLIRICVRRSTDLNRKIKGWVLGIAGYL